MNFGKNKNKAKNFLKTTLKDVKSSFNKGTKLLSPLANNTTH
jgi:hypothetical protein